MKADGDMLGAELAAALDRALVLEFHPLMALRRLALRPFGAAIAGTLVLLWLAIAAGAHDAPPTQSHPLGWKYPFSCCSSMDCRPVPASAIRETPQGYVITATGEVVAYSGDVRLKDSPDGEFHWCSVAGAPDGRTICLFVPPRGF